MRAPWRPLRCETAARGERLRGDCVEESLRGGRCVEEPVRDGGPVRVDRHVAHLDKPRAPGTSLKTPKASL
jgi:hypothetical protein